MKRWLRLEIILSIVMIALTYIASFIWGKISPAEGLQGLNPINLYQFPPPFITVLISSLIIGFVLGIIISFISRKKNKDIIKNEDSKSIR